jgi:hypothetical protein
MVDIIERQQKEIYRLRDALNEIAGWTLPSGRDAQDVARKALTAPKGS